MGVKSDGRIVAGRIATPGPGLLPDGLRVGATDAVFLGVVPALRHTGVPARSGRHATVFVVPTDQGPQAIVCTSVAATPCEAVAATLQQKGALNLDGVSLASPMSLVRLVGGEDVHVAVEHEVPARLRSISSSSGIGRYAEARWLICRSKRSGTTSRRSACTTC